jgi:hypothetical protein
VERAFLLSPARCNSERAQLLVTSRRSAMAQRLRDGEAELGEVFAWLSALYFRGKLAYARRFARPGGALVMAPGLGLAAPELALSTARFAAMAGVEVQSDAFVKPLVRDARRLARRFTGEVVLLGSIATGKYLDCLLEVFGARLVFPESFVGRGDMSRGGLLLRAAASGEELAYRAVEGATLRGRRPPRLGPNARPAVEPVAGAADRRIRVRR